MNNYSSIRLLTDNEPIPYNLLLLADEEMQAIGRYIYQSDIYVIEEGQRVIGTYVLCRLDENTAEIKAIAVDEHYQNMGIGKLLLKHADVIARKRGFNELLIGTPSVAAKQLSIYQKAGFIWFDTKKDFFITCYTNPIFENGIRLKDMAMLRKVF